MNLATRVTLLLLLVCLQPLSCVLLAQDPPSAPATEDAASTAAPSDPATAPATATPAGTDGLRSSLETRSEFVALLAQNPPELATILALDPTLLSDDAFLARNPELARFVAKHPEVRHHPRYYLSDVNLPGDFRPRGVVEQMAETISILFVFCVVAFALAWLVRTLIEQKRWNRLSRTQNEVHNKILDRFGSSEELLAYIKTPVGTKFLESAPIPLHNEPARPNAPVSRAMWSIQIGIIIAAAAVGFLIVSDRFVGETGQGLSAMGVVALCVGIGFVGSAGISIFLSRRLGLWQMPNASTAPDETGAVQ
jgi:hypothetical protein